MSVELLLSRCESVRDQSTGTSAWRTQYEIPAALARSYGEVDEEKWGYTHVVTSCGIELVSAWGIAMAGVLALLLTDSGGSGVVRL